MKKAMIVTVGTGSDVENGIRFSIVQNNPSLVFFVCSMDSLGKVKAVKQLLKESPPRYRQEMLDEVNDVEVIYGRLSAVVDSLTTMGFAPHQITADYTSGTKSMSAALVSVAIARELGALSYVHGDRDANGRVRSGTERLIPLRPNAIFSRERLKTFCRLFDRYRFDAALSVLEGSSTHPSMESENRVFLQLAKCYSAWDRFDFKTAVDMMASIDLKELSRIERFKSLSAALSQQKQFIFRIDERNRRREYSELDVMDLFSNALRRKEEGRYDDCVSRLYRLVEMVGQIEFQKAFRMSTSRADLAKLPEHVVSAMGFKDRKGVVELPLFKTYSGLSVVKGSSIAKAFHDNRERFREYLLVRNNSRLAHGLKPIGRKVCEEFVELVREVFKVEDEVRFVRLSEMF